MKAVRIARRAVGIRVVVLDNPLASTSASFQATGTTGRRIRCMPVSGSLLNHYFSISGCARTRMVMPRSGSRRRYLRTTTPQRGD